MGAGDGSAGPSIHIQFTIPSVVLEEVQQRSHNFVWILGGYGGERPSAAVKLVFNLYQLAVR